MKNHLCYGISDTYIEAAPSSAHSILYISSKFHILTKNSANRGGSLEKYLGEFQNA